MLCSGGAGRQARAHLVLPERIWYNSIVLAQPVSESLSPFRAADGRKPFVATIEFYERGGIVKGFLNNRRVSCTLSALCFIALGVFLVFWPELSRIWICRLLGASLLVSGGVYVVSHFARAKGAAAVFQYDLILGAVLAVVGVWLLTTPDLIVAFLQYILGLILIVHGVIDLQGALNLRAAPSYDAPVYLQIPNGETVTVWGEYDNWYVVEYDGTFGYVRGEYLRLNGESVLQPR